MRKLNWPRDLLTYINSLQASFTYYSCMNASHASTSFKYAHPLIALHWLMFLFLVLTYAAIEFRVLFIKGTPERDLMKTLHFLSGLSIFLLLFFRVLARKYSPSPLKAFSSGFSSVLHHLSTLGHAALYVFMFTMPLLGWMVLSASGKTLLFAGVGLPALASADPDLAELLKELHETMGKAGYLLIGIHVFAAFFHQWILKDRLFSRLRWR